MSTDGIQPTDLMGIYITIGDYIPDGQLASPEGLNRLVDELLSVGSLEQRARTLVLLNHVNGRPGGAAELTVQYLESIRPDLAERLRNTLERQDGINRFLLARQGILAALRRTLLQPEPDDGKDDVDYLWESILLVHAVSTLLYEHQSPTDPGRSYAGLAGPVTMEIIRNELFYARRLEGFSSLSRLFLLWTRYGRRITKTSLRAEPTSLLLEATGLEIEDWLVCSLAVQSRMVTGDILWSIIDSHSPAMRDAFLDQVRLDPASARSKLRDNRGEWDFLVFQRYPLIEIAGDVLVVDDRYLLERMAEGPYWNVSEHEKSISEGAWLRWTQSYGEMVESYVLDVANRMVPPVLDGGRSVYYEDELLQAYPGKVCDLLIDYGDVWWCLEIVSSQVTTDTRIDGKMRSFDKDTEKIVLKKVRQLDTIIRRLLRDETAITGRQAVVGRRVVPTIVNLGTYPVNPVAGRHIDELLKETDLLQDSQIEPLCVIDIGEIELLEGLFTNKGHNPVEVLREWKQSPLSQIRLFYYLDTQPRFTHLAVGTLYPVREGGEDLVRVFEEYLDSVL